MSSCAPWLLHSSAWQNGFALPSKCTGSTGDNPREAPPSHHESAQSPLLLPDVHFPSTEIPRTSNALICNFLDNCPKLSFLTANSSQYILDKLTKDPPSLIIYANNHGHMVLSLLAAAPGFYIAL